MFNRGHWKKFVLDQDGPAVGAKDKKGNPSYDVAGADKTSFSTDFLTDRTIEFIEEPRTSRSWPWSAIPIRTVPTAFDHRTTTCTTICGFWRRGPTVEMTCHHPDGSVVQRITPSFAANR